MLGKIEEILSAAKIFEWRIANFKDIENHLIECRARRRIPKNAKSIIMVAFPYKVEEEPPKNISRYAAVPDYHTVCGEMLNLAVENLRKNFKENSFEWFLDNSPIPEVFTANLCGLGVMGKNGLLIHKEYGSFVFLGEIVTDLDIPFQKGGEKCLDCGECSRACEHIPLKENCLSAVNQQKNPLSSEKLKQIKSSGIVWGCDKCSEVCPMNKNAKITYIEEFKKGYRNSFTLSESREGRAYNWRGKEVIERNFNLINSK